MVRHGIDLSEAFRGDHTQVPWKRLVDLRNFYIHVYDAVEFGRVWTTVTRLVPGIEVP